jgi:hypothetical protein
VVYAIELYVVNTILYIYIYIYTYITDIYIYINIYIIYAASYCDTIAVSYNI